MENEFSNFILEIDKFKNSIQNELYNGVDEVGRRMAENARDFSAYDTGTLRSSWGVRQDNIINEDGNKQIEVWSNPDIIATNPKHPNGEYYSIPQEEGYMTPGGVWKPGRWMLSSSMEIAKEELPQVLEEKISKVFDLGW